MNSFKSLFSIGFLLGLSLGYFAIGFGAMAYDLHYANKACTHEDVQWAKSFPEHYAFEKISVLFWRAQCKPNKPLLIISASEGGVPYKFSQAFMNLDNQQSWEIRGAHRGVKSLAYVLAMSEESAKITDQPIIAFINPVYFGFAARTDDAAMMSSSISSLLFQYTLPHWKYKYQSLVLSAPFFAAKNLENELSLVKSKWLGASLNAGSAPTPVPDQEYDFGHHMTKERVANYATAFKKDKFNFYMEPTHSMLKRTLRIIEQRKLPVCLVFLPLNDRHLSQVREDAPLIKSSLQSALEKEIPSKLYLDLMDIGSKPYLFMDSMHFTDFGIHEISKRVIESDCYKRVNQRGT